MLNSRSRSPERAGVERGGRVRGTVLALCAVIGMVVSQSASAQLLVDPLEVTIFAAGTNRVAASFSLANTSAKVVQATITRSDWDRAENGDNRFVSAGSSGTSCGAMLGVSPLSVRVEPHGSRVVRLSVQPGAALTKECWDIFFVEEVPQRSSTKGNSLQYIFRTGVKVYVAPPGLSRDGAIENMAVEDVAVPRASSSANPGKTGSSGPPATKRPGSGGFHNTRGIQPPRQGALAFCPPRKLSRPESSPP